MSRVPLRARLTIVFAAATITMLAGAAAFVYAELRADLDETIDETIEARLAAPGAPVEDAEDAFTEVVAAGGRSRALTAEEIERAPFTVERRVDGIDGVARVRAEPRRGEVVVAGQSLEDRDETLAGLLMSFAIGGAVAVALASLLGYALAGAALRPMLRSFERERRFVADASHELRTPIAVIKTELEGALRSGDDRASLVAAIEECDHLAQLTEDLLVLARAGDGALPVDPRPLGAHEVLEATRARFADRAAHQGREIVVVAPADVTLRADPLRLRQALGNLVDNALRHGRGRITLRARDDEVAVADEGTGFEPAMFERFARGSEARTREDGGGAGLGLAIVRAIAEAHGGGVTVRGAEVSLRLSA
jgi:signal transduction histidine kinase